MRRQRGRVASGSRGIKMRIVALCALATASIVLAGCTGTGTNNTESPAGSAADHGPVTSAAIENLDASACSAEAAEEMRMPDVSGILCGTLTVPLDHANASGNSLTLDVAIREGDRERGVLVLLGGGPGGTARWTTSLLAQLMPEVAEQYQLVAMDPRGTGSDALDCPALQAQVGSSDLLTASPDTITDCAAILGERAALQSTAATVADLELLREALGVESWVLDGTSYGTFVAQQYAALHPDAITALVLDSLVPAEGVDPFLVTTMASVPRVLGEVCEAESCDFEPAEAIEEVLAQGYPALPLLNALVSSSVMDPTFTGVLDALQAAAGGDHEGLDSYVATMRDLALAEPVAATSAGSHIATLCADTPMPWGGADTAEAQRAAPLAAAVEQISPDDTWPFPASLAAELGTVEGCLHWPTTAYSPPATDKIPEIPTLILTGARDLSTPVANAEAATQGLPHAKSVVIPDAGHAAQMQPAGSAAVTDFLLGL